MTTFNNERTLSLRRASRSSAHRGFGELPFMPEVCLAVIGLAAMWLMPGDLSFLTRIITSALFVLSLDLVLGYAGIVTLGHAAMFGVGAYAAGVYAIHVTAEPLSGLLMGGLFGGLIALATGAVLLRTHGLTCLMMTIAIAQILLEVLNKWRSLTGGDDGLSGIMVEPIFGVIEFDFFGRTGYLYSLAVLIFCFWIMRRLVRSPFGLTCIGIREDRFRMTALGANVYKHTLVMYVAGGIFAGIAGALMAQTTQVVGLSSLGFTWSAEALVMLVLGGMGHLWGAIFGTILFMVVHHFASAIDPFKWMFVIGALLVAVVLLFPEGLVQAIRKLAVRQIVRLSKRGAP